MTKSPNQNVSHQRLSGKSIPVLSEQQFNHLYSNVVIDGLSACNGLKGCRYFVLVDLSHQSSQGGIVRTQAESASRCQLPQSAAHST